MSTRLAREPQAILRSLAKHLLELCLIDIDDPTLPWPRNLNDIVQHVPPLNAHSMVSRPTITVTLCKIGVPVNDTVTERIKIYRIAFAFRNLASTRRSLYVDLPVRWRTNQVSQVIRGALLLEIYQWISNLPRKNSLIIRRVRSMHQEMCTLVDGLSDAQLDMQFTPNSQPGAERTFNVPLGVVVIRVHSATQVMFRIKTTMDVITKSYLPVVHRYQPNSCATIFGDDILHSSTRFLHRCL